MATVTQTPPKANSAKAPVRARKPSVKSAAKATTAKPASKRAARKPAQRKAAAETIAARVTLAEKGAAQAASDAAGVIRAAAERARSAAHVTEAAEAAKGMIAKVRKAVMPAPKKSVPRRASSARKRSTGVGTGTVLGVAAAGLAVGIAANLGRKAAVQAPSVMAGDWLEALKTEHKAALALLDKLAKSTPEQPAKRTLLLTQLKHALGKHAFTEENVIYPALREWGDKADADALNHEQGYHKQYLYELDNLDKAAPEFAQKVADFRADLNAHIREEEDKIFPKIHAGLDEAKNKALTAAANREGFKLA